MNTIGRCLRTKMLGYKQHLDENGADYYASFITGPSEVFNIAKRSKTRKSEDTNSIFETINKATFIFKRADGIDTRFSSPTESSFIQNAEDDYDTLPSSKDRQNFSSTSNSIIISKIATSISGELKLEDHIGLFGEAKSHLAYSIKATHMRQEKDDTKSNPVEKLPVSWMIIHKDKNVRKDAKIRFKYKTRHSYNDK